MLRSDQADHDDHELLFKVSSVNPFPQQINPNSRASSDHVMINHIDDHESPEEKNRRKMIHKDVEKQRRKEMASLYSSLRSLLPVHYLKGKRPLCDHLNETVNYIIRLQNEIEELSSKRNELRRLSLSSLNHIPTLVDMHNCKQEQSILVRPSYGGVKVLLETSIRHEPLLSKVLQVLIKQGLQIVTCISTKKEDRFLLTIESEVNGGGDIELTELQQRLTNLILRTC